MPAIGAGVREIRIRDAVGALRVIYIATFADAVHVLHAFQKKTQKDPSARSGPCRRAAPAIEARTTMKAQTFTNVWDALEDNPEDAANMTMRSDVMIAIKNAIR